MKEARTKPDKDGVDPDADRLRPAPSSPAMMRDKESLEPMKPEENPMPLCGPRRATRAGCPPSPAMEPRSENDLSLIHI